MTELLLGPEVVRLLIPQRPPLLLVDRVLAFDREKPSVRCDKYVSANEPVFVGHFPSLALWPGAYTIEGLGQTANLLEALCGLMRACEAAGEDPDALLDALRDVHAAHRLAQKPRRRHAVLDAFEGPARIAMTAAVDVKLLEPVFAGQCLEYEVARTHANDGIGRFAVTAWSQGRPVARGSITGSAKLSLGVR
jgi:3-hydroxyacyl-[acyl-carrier-protein] dehydratase